MHQQNHLTFGQYREEIQALEAGAFTLQKTSKKNTTLAFRSDISKMATKRIDIALLLNAIVLEHNVM